MLEPISLLGLVVIAAIGLAAGVLGGMLGVGGSVIMIPGLTLALGYDQHLYQAAAMIANVAVSVPAALRHRRAGAIDGPTLRWMGPAAVVCVILGVWLSNRPLFAGTDGGLWLGRVLAVFLVYVILVNLRRLRGEKGGEPPAAHDSGRRGERARSPLVKGDADASARSQGASCTRGRVQLAMGRLRPLSVGSVMGLIAGLLGIGGGAVAVPLQQVLLRLPLKSAIANSATIICFSAAIGAIYKNATLGLHGHTPTAGLTVAAMLAPTAWLGGRAGASLTHRLPIRQVRIAFIALMVVAAWKMAALPLG